MKILYVVEHYHPYIGGVEKLFKTLCEEVAAQGDEVTVVTTLHNKRLQQKETLNGVSIRRIPVKNRYLFTFFGWIWILKYAKGKDLIHTTSYNAALPAFFTGLFMRKKVIVTFHEVWQEQWFEVPFLSAFERWGFFLYEKFILKLTLPAHPFYFLFLFCPLTPCPPTSLSPQDLGPWVHGTLGPSDPGTLGPEDPGVMEPWAPGPKD